MKKEETLVKAHPISQELYEWLKAHHRIYTEETLRHFGLGQGQYQGEPCLVLPMSEKFQNLYFWKRGNSQSGWQHFLSGHGILIGDIEDAGEILWCASVWDFLTLWDHGFKTVVHGTIGAGRLPKKASDAVKGRDVIIVCDFDAGGKAGAKRMASLLLEAAHSVKIAELPVGIGEHGDASDYFHSLGRTPAEFQAEVLRPAKRYRPETEEALQTMDELDAEQSLVAIHPAQDFVNGVMYYAAAKSAGFKTSGKKPELYLLTSERRLFPACHARALGLSLKHEDVQDSQISRAAIRQFLEGQASSSMARLYDRIQNYIGEYIVLRETAYHRFLSLWVMGTYVHRLFRYYPYIWLNSVVKGSGKTLLMEILQPIVFNGYMCVNPTPALVYRYVSENAPTFMIDEMEQMRHNDRERHGEIMAILNAGFNRNGCVARCEPTGQSKFRWVSYSTYSPKIFAGLSDLDDVLRDRTIRISMIKMGSEPVKPYDESEAEAIQQQLRDELYWLGLIHAPAIAEQYRVQTLAAFDHLCHRERDIWRPIFALARLVDQERGTEDVTSEMARLSRQLTQLKQQEDAAVNQTLQLLMTWKEMIDTHQVSPQFVEDDGDTLWYKSDRVFEIFKATDAFAWMKQRKTLTRRLHRIQIRLERRRVACGSLESFYQMNRKEFEDLYQRLVPGPIKYENPNPVD